VTCPPAVDGEVLRSNAGPVVICKPCGRVLDLPDTARIGGQTLVQQHRSRTA
jgi:hypothetical protein